jgi:chromosome segregation protein
MRIRSLEIAGFKSFAERVVLAFEPGISAIVGPNGCGKSNVVDAIRWVMGEHNPRHLRGREMDDLIFTGSDSKPPTGMAEVVMTLDTADGRLPAEYAGFPEIQIARRLYRDGESEYLINRVPVRRRDVTDFFLDTGVGVRGYTIVEQGHIQTIVSTRPEDRRSIIEEAAGIGKYRARRRETESKLRSTEQNLLRVRDVLGELNRQIGSLDRQARKAARYKELSAHVRDLELTVAREELDGHSEAVSRTEREVEEVRARALALDAQVSNTESRLEAGRREHLDREKELGESSERLYEVRSEIQSLESRLEYERREREGLVELARERETEGQELDARLAERRSELRSAIEALGFAEERLEREQGELGEREMALEAGSRLLSELTGRREAAQARLAELLAEQATLESRAEALEERRTELEQRLRTEDEALESSTLEAESMRSEQDSLEIRLRGSLAEQDDLGRRLGEGLHAHRAAVAELERLREARAAAQEELQRVEARLESLRESERQAAERAARALEALPDAQRRRVRGRLSEVLDVEEGAERALETALASRLDALLVTDAPSALGLIEWLRSAEAGRATVLASEAGSEQPRPGIVPLGRPLLQLVSAKPPFEPLVRRLLREVYLVDDLSEAVERFGLGDPPAVFVTRAGEILDRSGALTGGAGAPPGTLSRAGEIRRLEEALEELQVRARELLASERRASERTDALAQETDNLRSRRHTAELAVLHVEKDLERVQERAKEAAEAAEEHRSGRGSLAAELERLIGERERALARLVQLRGERADADSQRERLVAEIGERSREHERLEQRLMQQRVELAQLGERRDQQNSRREGLQRSADEDAERSERLRAEVASARERAEALARSGVEGQANLAEQIRREEELRVRQEQIRSAFNTRMQELESLEAASRDAQKEREASRERLSASELAVQEVRMRRDAVCERIRERYHIDLAAFEIPEGMRDGDAGARREELERFRRSLESLGDVHLGAIEEYEEVSERFRYLTEQKEDLEVSVERLRNAIARINRTSRSRFRETFEAVNEEFKKLYPVLFRGGRAHLSLTEAEDVLESGIDIHAQPPGKKLQNVNLLSGGEKAMTAIALLFAVFRIKPSPFFLLDEVDAALDDANVGRFNELVSEMSSGSQFLVITHNKGTIEIAKTLFGVTMETPGESKLVTVDLVA